MLTSALVQTDEILLCHKCDFEAEDIYDLEAHTYIHAPEQYLTCRYCGVGFDTKDELMVHRKRHHTDAVNLCRDFSNGICPYEDRACWYKHCKAGNDYRPDLTTFKCNSCDETFTTKSGFMYHNKENHKNNISECKQSRSGTCWFGDKKCWFNHNSNDENSEKRNDEELSENQEMIEKILSMMENFTKRIKKWKIEEKI